MEAKTKKRLLIGGSLLVIGGIAAYLIWQHRKNKQVQQPPVQDSQTGTGGTTDAAAPAQSPSNSATPKQSKSGAKQSGIPTGSEKAMLVKLTDYIIGSDFSAANGKAIYAGVDGLSIYNLAGKKAGAVKKGDYLGTVNGTSKLGDGGYWVGFTGTNTVNYKMPATGVMVKVN